MLQNVKKHQKRSYCQSYLMRFVDREPHVYHFFHHSEMAPEAGQCQSTIAILPIESESRTNKLKLLRGWILTLFFARILQPFCTNKSTPFIDPTPAAQRKAVAPFYHVHNKRSLNFSI